MHPPWSPVLQVFACTVGQKPSRAPFYVNDPADVLSTLSKLAELSEQGPVSPNSHRVAFK